MLHATGVAIAIALSITIAVAVAVAIVVVARVLSEATGGSSLKYGGVAGGKLALNIVDELQLTNN